MLQQSTRTLVPSGQANEPLMHGAFLRKRAFDLVFSTLVTLLLLSWVIPLVALFIKYESEGPVFFKQLRTGKNGVPFYCLKFRSMFLNPTADSQQATRGDYRITKIGAFLRKTSLDELPQFLNVLRGDMSIVGPRPHMLQHTATYAQQIPQFMDRHTIMPGITGLAQVSGYRGETTAPEAMAKRVNTDLEYVRNWSFWLDIKIMLRTAGQLLEALRGREQTF